MKNTMKTAMATMAAMAMLAATGTAMAGNGVEVQMTQERPTAGGTSAVMGQRALTQDSVQARSTELDQRPEPGNGGGSGASNGTDPGATGPNDIRPLGQTQADGGWVCQVLQTALGEYVDISMVCN